MVFQYLVYDTSNGVAKIMLNRPEVHHALNEGLLSELHKAFLMANHDEQIRVIILTASGDAAFCSGADLRSLSSQKTAGEVLEQYYHPLIHAIRNIEKPIIGRINGIAVGAGMSLALACDILVASKDIYFSEMFVAIGLLPDASSMFFLPRTIGFHKTFELCSTGRKIYMEEALQLGFVNKVVEAQGLDQAVEDLAILYAHSATRSIGLMKKILNQTFSLSLEAVLNLEAKAQTELANSQDFKEGVLAFLQKRKANFTGK